MMAKYRSVFLNIDFEPVKSLKDFKKWDQFRLVLYKGDTAIGNGYLQKVRYAKGKMTTCLQTENVFLKAEFRRQGHGIHLYHALIRRAKILGAVRIYSSAQLNKYSKRVWADKLPEFYHVQPAVTRKPCGHCDSKKPRTIGYYIQLKREQ